MRNVAIFLLDLEFVCWVDVAFELNVELSRYIDSNRFVFKLEGGWLVDWLIYSFW